MVFSVVLLVVSSSFKIGVDVFISELPSVGVYGSVTKKVLPLCFLDFSVIFPSSKFVFSLAIHNPKPNPPMFFVDSSSSFENVQKQTFDV